MNLVESLRLVYSREGLVLSTPSSITQQLISMSKKARYVSVISPESKEKMKYADERRLEIQVNLFRVAFLLERMCPLEYGLGSKFNETYFMHYKSAIDHITVTKGACQSMNILPRSP